MVLFEMVPADIAAEVTQLLHVPTIGIGAGSGTSGTGSGSSGHSQYLCRKKAQILEELYGRSRFYSRSGCENYVKSAVKSKDFPTQSHSF